jgi:hypothetical protein
MRRFAILLFALRPLFAQSLAEPARLAAVREVFEGPQARATLDCQFTPIQPALNYSLRFRSGFAMRTPLKSGAWTVYLKIKPQSGEPVYLMNAANQPGEVTAEFLVGEGKYRVQAVARDDAHRLCRAQWEIHAKFDSAARKLTPAMPHGGVAEITAPLPRPAAETPKLGRVTILLHAAPLSPRSSKLQTSDQSMLLDSLSALQGQLPARSLRLVVFNLEQQRVLYRKDGFKPSDLPDVGRAVEEIQLATVDYRTLQNAAGSAGLLTDLIRSELLAAEPSGEVVFLGPQSRPQTSIAKDAFGAPDEIAPRFYYLQYRRLPRLPGGRFGGGNGPPMGMGRGMALAPGNPRFSESAATDGIAQAVGRLKGKTIVLHTPADFAAAIRRLTPANPH